MQADDTILRIFVHPNHTIAVFIVRRANGLFSFCKETLEERFAKKLRLESLKLTKRDIAERILVNGLHAGLYADEQGAIYEAMCRVEWLSEVFSKN